MEAQRYPADYNGIMAGAPAINWTKFIPAEIWPELVMKESHDFLPACNENAFVESAVQACATTQRVQQAMGGPQATDSFARLFLASGAQHCASAAGPAPAQPLDAVVSWVEHGTAPTSILGTTTDPATGVVTDSRPICLYPQFARYTGSGSTTNANSFVCAR
jgi:hypothetical protein